MPAVKQTTAPETELRVRPYPRASIDLSAATHGQITKQAHKDEVDINRIMQKYKKTGIMDFQSDVGKGRYIDLMKSTDYHSSMNQMVEAQRAFDALPSNIRSAFHNDPSEFLEFVANPKNVEKGIELGIYEKPSTGSKEPSGEVPPAGPAGGAAPAAGAPKAP